MKKNITYIISLVALLTSLSGNAQFYYYNNNYVENDITFELGGSVGIMNCLTDVGGKKGVGKKFIKDLNMKNSQLAAGGFISALYKSVIGLRLEGTFGKVKAYDSVLQGDASDAKFRYYRNLNFQSKVTEFSAMLEFHPLFLKSYDVTEDNVPKLSPYLLGGVSMYNFKPMGSINGRLVDLHSLHTEGQGFAEYANRKNYSLSQINVPLGAGIKYELGPLFNARLEVVHRILFTDYLDDVSTSYIDPATYATNLSASQATLAQAWYNRSIPPAPLKYDAGAKRGESKNNDAYFSFSLKLSFVLGRNKVN